METAELKKEALKLAEDQSPSSDWQQIQAIKAVALAILYLADTIREAVGDED